ncbi:MAG TPA: TIGR01777 family oxidoreductase [Dissulfurispiraceae bacterium]|nr:TIGR01777 family oxidoreductase [Dissulfurispiraceae bacterium]
MNVAMSGATGFVGTYLKNAFAAQGWTVSALGRDAFRSAETLREKLKAADIVVNLAGAPIAARWSDSYKKELYASRIDTTRALVSALAQLKNRPRLFISTSAIGVYPPDVECDEGSSGLAQDFLGRLAQDWEREASHAAELGVRTVIFRFGVVLGSGGALAKMLMPFRLGIGGVIGDGRQPFSWVHIDDLGSAFLFVIGQERCSGIYNLTAPNPVSNKTFTKALGAALHRPAILPVPTFVLKMKFGEGADVLIKGQHVLPRRLLESGFTFRYPRIDEALKNLLAERQG